MGQNTDEDMTRATALTLASVMGQFPVPEKRDEWEIHPDGTVVIHKTEENAMVDSDLLVADAKTTLIRFGPSVKELGDTLRELNVAQAVKFSAEVQLAINAVAKAIVQETEHPTTRMVFETDI